ncbi:PEP-CTERM sorting domain-containing protein [Akkermansiaceae bacterium]|nr:PEP-CTERM sorting domain-containing protein [Akkermansiaceae bacterium]
MELDFGELTVVPEPTTGALAGLSLLALAFRRRR